MKTPWLVSLGAAAVLLTTAGAGAQSTDGAVRLGFDFEFLGLDVLSVEGTGVEEDDRVTISSGFAFDDTFLGIGYGASERLTLGLRARSGSVSTLFTDIAGDPTRSEYHVTGLPYLEVNLSDSGTLRPFLGPTIGLEVTVTEVRTDVSDDVEFQSADVTFLFGALFGARIFVNDTFAVEPTLLATYGLGAFSQESADGLDLDGDTRVFTLMLLFCGSAWLGGEQGKSPDPEPLVAPAPYEPAPYVPPPAETAPAPPAQPAPQPQPAPAPAPAQPAPGGAAAPTAPAPEPMPPAPPPAGPTGP
jgi:hypothetical protein